jgi:hypothetical protein
MTQTSNTDSMAAPNSPLLRIVSAACALAAIVGFTSPARAAVDRALSIAASFDAFWAAARDRPFTEQQEAWDRLIERPRRDLYASVVWEIDHHRHCGKTGSSC